jgi:pilus assembly protein Flp/PilA
MSNHLAVLEAWLRSRSDSDGEHESETESDNEHGAALVEYALLVALIAIVCIGTVTLLGAHVAERLTATGTSLN